MIYDLSNEIERKSAITKFKAYLDKNAKVDLKIKHNKRSIKQNAYLHLILSYFGTQTGYTLEEVKQEIFKKIVNKEIFYNGKKGQFNLDSWRSSSDLDSNELTQSIDRFINYAAIEAGISLPVPEDLQHIEYIEKEVSKHKSYV
jgi:hypothetical protein